MSSDQTSLSSTDEQSKFLPEVQSGENQSNQSSYSPPGSSEQVATSVIDKHGPTVKSFLSNSITNLYTNQDSLSAPDQGASVISVTKVPNSSTLSCDIPSANKQSIYSTSNFDNNVNLSDRDEERSVEQECSKTDDNIEKFGGKIVYNPDGSAYIIEDGDLSDEDSLIPLPKHEGSIVDKHGHKSSEDEEEPAYPQIANAIYVTRSAAYYNALYGQAYAKLLREKLGGQEAPIVHSYRVYSVRDGGKETTGQDPPLVEHSIVPVKPILMCFVCKLSFGNASSFVGHCVGEHNTKLTEEEKNVLNAKNSSAILQMVGKEKEPLVSFLEPVIKSKENEREKQALSPNAIKGLLSAALSQQQLNVPNPRGMSPIRHQLPGASTSAGGDAGPPQHPLRLLHPNFQMPNLENSPEKRGEMQSQSIAASLLLENLTSAAMLRNSFVESLSRRSPSSNMDNGRSGSVSPVTPMGGGVSPMSQMQPSGFASNANMLQGTTIGACPEHINGRQAGIECANCDLILNVSRVPGGVGWNAARNTCKTLKCPKCNWHYKYQETLEIHMKEKHPESETTCIYCITGQQHPRLARGETYTCGYKPYRCEVCNYSTTTKGNLSIHMQSDKHLNNMQELQNGGVVASPEGISLPQSPGGMNRGNPMMNNPLANINKQKPSWRCDVCNYETGVARNLRIHMTSEKHTHNIMVLQQNVKHIQQQLSHQQPGLPMGPPGMFPGMPGLDPQTLFQLQMGGMGFPGGGGNMSGNQGEKPGPPEAAIADIAYLQALMMQMMTGGQFPPGPQPPDFGMLLGAPGGPGSPISSLDCGVNPDTMEPPPEPPDPNPKHLFNCCVCQDFGCDSLEVMSQHLTLDRSNMRENEVAIVIGTNYICKLCSYKTNLKANFQLHCKTDKHLQRLNHVNHIKEGGPENEWKLKFLTVSNPVQLRCNACDYYTNSLHKLQLHVANQRHEISNILFAHLIKKEQTIPDERRTYHCLLCKFIVPGKLALMNHVKTIKHLQMEQIHQLQKRSEGNEEQTEIGDIFQVQDSSRLESSVEEEDDENEERDNEQQDYEKESALEESEERSKDEESAPSSNSRCPLCQEAFSSDSSLETHVLHIHSVNSEGLQRLLMLMEGSHWLNNNNRQGNATPSPDSLSDEEGSSRKDDDENSTAGSSKLALNSGATPKTPSPMGGTLPGGLQPSMGTISERHVYKYRCSQCSLAFKTQEKLTLHSQYHAIRESTKCRICARSFRSIQALLKHVETGHNEVPSEELAQYKLALMNHPLLIAGMSGQILDSATSELLKKEASLTSSCIENDDDDEIMEVTDETNKEGNNLSNCTNDSTNSTKDSSSEKVNLQSSPCLDFMPRKVEKSLNYPLEKYLDPNRPYKCDVCKESFTQKNILLVHYNSVSHLHKLKKTIQGQHIKDQALQQQGMSPIHEKSPSSSRMTSLETALNNLASAKQMRDDDEAKPYKCNICKVAYNQSSTLDIHIRSVLHQGRASKLQELAMTGQVDLSKPLIEQPDSKHVQEQHKKILQDLMSPKSLNSSSCSSANQSSPNPTNLSSSSISPMSSPLSNIHQALINSSANQGANQNRLMGDLIQTNNPQQHMLQLLQALPVFQNLTNPSNKMPVPPMSPKSNDEMMKLPFAMMEGKRSSQTVRNLLENYGFELVMQFNEYHQRKRQQDEEERKRREEEEIAEKSKQEDEMRSNEDPKNKDKRKEGEPEVDTEAEKEQEENKLPEIVKSKCPVCQKEFSSIWVLKAHSEEIHKDVVPPEFLEKYVEELKSNLDKSKSDDSESEGTPEKNSSMNKESCFLTPEKSSEDEQPNFCSTSTPKSPPTPIPTTSTEDVQDKPPRPSSVISVENSKAPSASVTPNLPEMPSAFQQAILSAQQQSQNINPMLLQMAQLQGMNPLVAMNLHPPLVPPSMLPSGSNTNQMGMDHVASAFLSQLQAAQEQHMQSSAQMNMLSKLGIDNKMIAQTGLDPKVLLQLGQIDPKIMMQSGMDPKILSMLATCKDLENGNQANEAKALLQMIQMGLPQPHDPKLLAQLAQFRGEKSLRDMNMQQQPPPPPPPPFGMDKKLPFPNFPPFDQPNFGQNQNMSDPKSMMMSQKPVFQHPEQAKRARTRITDEQLKVLRSNFDINNSPAENQIHTMSQQTGLPPKVIKHWFRNTLFKERQRNKDSPYNFNNPPSTMLNLEEYEKTGDPKVLTLKQDEHEKSKEEESNDDKDDIDKDDKDDDDINEYTKEESTSSVSELRVRNDEELFKINHTPTPHPPLPTTPLAVSSICNTMMTVGSPIPAMSNLGQQFHPSNASTPTTPVSERSSPCSSNLTLSSILSSQMSQMGKANASFMSHHLVPGFPGLGGGNPLSNRLPDFLNPLANMMAGPDHQQANRQAMMQSPTPQGQGGSSQGKRANRTRFTDYQIKVLQEFFENNAYPKDDDLEYLSKLLNLSPRVIVVWFQNARQKARKIYENQPPLDPNDEGAGRFTRTPGLNYQCKKCLLVFQRYYELIRHQKQHCFKEEDAKRSAQAQKAAAQAAAQFSRQQSSGGMNLGGMSASHTSDDSNSSTGLDRYVASPVFNQSGHPDFMKRRPSDDWLAEAHMRNEDHKKMTPSMFDQLTREESFSKILNPAPSTLFPSAYPPSTPFGILQQQGLPYGLPDRDSGDELDNESLSSSPSSKRKLSDDGMDTDEREESGQPRDKRLRTTILPEQLDFLYQKYQIESNPSRKMLEQIASEVGLRKRVVQVWFQNTRARERKGQFRAHQQVINKRCPFCPAIFRVRSALESHLSSKHIDQYTRGEIDIDSLPDAEGFHEGSFIDQGRGTSTPISLPGPPPPLISTPTPGFSQSQDLEQSMRKYYEDTMKRYMNDLQGSRNEQCQPNPRQSETPPTPSAHHRREGPQALDLTTPPPPSSMMPNCGPALDLSGSRMMPENDDDSTYWDKDDQSICSENNNDFDGDESMSHQGDGAIQSPASPSMGGHQKNGSNDSVGSMNNKRFRTQMSGIQIKLMKSVFQFYKTPTMSECASLGRDIGLQKRVVQVWFQNARAKEKKARLQLHQMTGKEPDMPPPPPECNICNHIYTNAMAVQDHLFDRAHLENVRLAIEQGRYEPQAPGELLNQAIAALEGQKYIDPPSPALGSSPSNNPQLQILQMAAQGIRLPPPPPEGAEGSAPSSDETEHRQSMEKALMQLYGMGRGISYPSGVPSSNPFLHPAMFSASGK